MKCCVIMLNGNKNGQNFVDKLQSCLRNKIKINKKIS